MTRLLFCDYHNMVAILEKGEHNSDFYPMVDCLEASPLRRNLKLRDEDGISSLPDAKLFENLTLMGYNISPNQKFTFQKGQFSHQWKYLIHTIMQCLSPKSIGFNEFSSNIATALVCLATNRTYNFSKMIFDGLVKNINNKGEGSGTPTEPHHTPYSAAQTPSHTTQPTSLLPPISTTSIPPVTSTETTPIRQYTRRARIAQSSALPPVADEPASPVRDVSQGDPTDSGFITDQDRATIAKSFTLPHDSAPMVTSPVADEGSMQPNITELTVLCTSLQRQHSELLAKFQAQEVEILKLKEWVKVLEDREGIAAKRSRDDAPIKGRSMDEGEAATERISDDTEEMATVLTSIDVATVLAGELMIEVVPTASPVFATATMVTLYSRRKGKEVMIESDTPKKQILQEQIDARVARELEEQQEREDKRMFVQIPKDAEVARIHAEEELQSMIDSLDRNNETIAKYLQEYQQFAAELPLERRIELIRDLVKYQENYEKIYKFQSQQRRSGSKVQLCLQTNERFYSIGSKEEAERYKRKAIRFNQESSKKLKSSEEVIEEAKSTDEIFEEKIKEMMQLIPIEEIYVEALQVKHPIIN
nr:glutamic acid-rich protein-like [Tanacetum cinerariifolium]